MIKLKTLSLFLILSITLMSCFPLEAFGMASPTKIAVTETQEDCVSTSQELIDWLNLHIYDSGTVTLTANITLTGSAFEYVYQGNDTLTINTGPYSLTSSSFINLEGKGLAVVGEGVDAPVLSARNLSLWGVSVTATGRDGQGGQAVHSTNNLTLSDSASLTAYGDGAKGGDCTFIFSDNASILVDGRNSIALKLTPWDADYYQPGELAFSTLKALGENAVSISATGAAQNVILTQCDITPEVGFGTDAALTPIPGWERFCALTSPEKGYRLPTFLTVNTREQKPVEAKLTWPTELPDFTVPGTYHLSATVSDCPITSLLGQSYDLTVQVGDTFLPVFNPPQPFYDASGRLISLRFAIPEQGDMAGSRTILWSSGDAGVSYQVTGNSLLAKPELSVTEFAIEQPCLLVLQSAQDGVMDGLSLVWSLTLHEDGSFTFVPTNLTPPSELNPSLTASTWEELESILQDEGRTQDVVAVTADLTVNSYISLQRKGIGLSLEMGGHSITVEDGGYLALDIDEVRGQGIKRPLISVESGGTLMLGNYDGTRVSLNSMSVTTNGDSSVALCLKAGGTLYAENLPTISAQGTGAVALKSLGQQPFSLPAGLLLKAAGNLSTALQASADVTVFYSRIEATGDNAQSVTVPPLAQVSFISAKATPMPVGAAQRTAQFLGFNGDIAEPMNIWKGAPLGMYLSDGPVLATLQDETTGLTQAVWVDVSWDDSFVDYTTVGSYTATGSVSPLLNLPLANLPETFTVEVGIRDGSGKPDISVIHPLPVYSIGGMPPNYGFTIYCNAPFTQEIATLWCSTDEGKSWQRATELFGVFFNSGCWRIDVSGLTPEQPYLFYLESSGQSGITNEFIQSGISGTRQVTLHEIGKITNIDSSGNRDGGDSEENTGSPPLTQQPPTPPIEEGVSKNPPQNTPEAGPSDSESIKNAGNATGDQSIPSQNTPADSPSGSDNQKPSGNTAGDQSTLTQKPDTGNQKTEEIPPSSVGNNLSQVQEAISSSSLPYNTGPTTDGKEPSTYEHMTEDSLTISGVRLAYLLQEYPDAVPFGWNGISIALSGSFLQEQGLKDEETLTLTMTRKADRDFTILLTIAGSTKDTIGESVVRISLPNAPLPMGLWQDDTLTETPVTYQGECAVFSITRTGSYRLADLPTEADTGTEKRKTPSPTSTIGENTSASTLPPYTFQDYLPISATGALMLLGVAIWLIKKIRRRKKKR